MRVAIKKRVSKLESRQTGTYLSLAQWIAASLNMIYLPEGEDPITVRTEAEAREFMAGIREAIDEVYG